MKWQRVFFWIFLCCLCVGQLQRLQLTPLIAIYAHEVVLSVWLLINARPLLRLIQEAWGKQPRSVQILIGFIAVQTLFWQAFDVQPVQLLYLARLCLYLLLVPLLALMRRQQVVTRHDLRTSVIVLGGVIATLGLLQYVFIPDTRFLIYSGWDDHYFRLISTLFDPNFSAIVIVMALLTLLQFGKPSLRGSYFLVPLLMLSILLTYSRAGYLAVAAGLIVLALQQKKKYPIGLLIVLCAAIPFLPRPDGEGVKLERTASITARMQSNQRLLTRLKPSQWVLGTSLYRQEQSVADNAIPDHATTPDNSFLFIISSLGIVGAILLGWVIWETRRQWSLVAIPPVWAAIAVHSLFNNTLFFPWVLMVVMLLTVAQLGSRAKRDLDL